MIPDWCTDVSNPRGADLIAVDIVWRDSFKFIFWLPRESSLIESATPLALAAEQGHTGIVTLLLGRDDVDPDSVDSEGCTPLARAAAMGHEIIVRQLLERSSVNINSKDKDGYTPLAWAARRGHTEAVRALVERRELDKISRDDDGWTPYGHAIDEGHEDVAKLLMESLGNMGFEGADGYFLACERML
ncbi:ankyrin [Penicillium angulare]|uniref:ankyrin n=1 Tax=Penicillium angulare TaxID=116970 RepID=UPI002541A354|nr:ankyrin [Penicillium angulare]KAJ5259335.1 ankyrin [Penicillium angulare]